MKYVLLLLAIMGFFLFGCTDTTPSKQYLCDDGQTVVAHLDDCPKIDKEYLECKESSSKPGAYDYESEKDICFYDLAVDRMNISLCKEIRTTSLYSYYSQAECGFEIALYLEDPSVCNKLSYSAKSDCFSKVAAELEDPSICSQLSSVSQKDSCLYDYLYSNLYYIDDWTICNDFSASAWEKSYCNYEAAYFTDDLSYCDKISDRNSYYSYTLASCYTEVAKHLSDPTICANLVDVDDRDDCYYYYATYVYDVEVCDYIVNSYWKDDCIDYANSSYYYD